MNDDEGHLSRFAKLGLSSTSFLLNAHTHRIFPKMPNMARTGRRTPSMQKVVQSTSSCCSCSTLTLSVAKWDPFIGGLLPVQQFVKFQFQSLLFQQIIGGSERIRIHSSVVCYQ